MANERKERKKLAEREREREWVGRIAKKLLNGGKGDWKKKEKEKVEGEEWDNIAG